MGVVVGMTLCVSWITLGVYAIIPTIIAGLFVSDRCTASDRVFPYVAICIAVFALGIVLRLAYFFDLLPFVDEWLFWLADARPYQSQLGADILSKPQGVETQYLMLVLGEFVMAPVSLYLAARPSEMVNGVNFEVRRLTKNEGANPFGLGALLMLFVLFNCYLMIGIGTEYRRMDIAATILPVVPLLATCSGILGWRLLVFEKSHTT